MNARPFIPALLWLATTALHAGNWPSWRGPNGDGVSSESGLPEKWSATENVVWKSALPGPGNSSPIVWGDRVWVTQSRAGDGARGLICFDAHEGRVRWEKWIPWKAREPSHETNPPCSASPVTDGERVIALFGSAGMVCWDLEGRELWRRDLGSLDHEWGYGASPVIHGDSVLVNFGPGKNSFLGAFDKATGEPRWKAPIPEVKPAGRTDGFQGREGEGVVGTWATPLLVRTSEREDLILPFNSQVHGFDPASGKVRWSCGGLTPLFYASPVAAGEFVFTLSGYRGNGLVVRAGGAGDVTDSRRLWHEEGAKSGIGSGVIHDGHVYYHAGSLGICREVQSGKLVWEERLRGSGSNADSWSSLLRAGDRLFVPNQTGDVIVFRASPKFEILSVNSVGSERCNASLAASNDRLWLRTHQHLWCFGRPAR